MLSASRCDESIFHEFHPVEHILGDCQTETFPQLRRPGWSANTYVGAREFSKDPPHNESVIGYNSHFNPEMPCRATWYYHLKKKILG